MKECEVIKLPPHKPGTKILMHDRDAEMYHAAGQVKMTGAAPPGDEPAQLLEGDENAE